MQFEAGRLDGFNFRMGGGIFDVLAEVVAFGNDFAVVRIDDDAADGDFIDGGSLLRQPRKLFAYRDYFPWRAFFC